MLSSIFSGPMPPRAGHGTVAHPPDRCRCRRAARRVRPRPSIAATVAAALAATRGGAAGLHSRRADHRLGADASAAAACPDAFLPRRCPATAPRPGSMRLEILRLHSQIKKLELELVAEREYTKALEQHVTRCRKSISPAIVAEKPGSLRAFLCCVASAHPTPLQCSHVNRISFVLSSFTVRATLPRARTRISWPPRAYLLPSSR